MARVRDGIGSTHGVHATDAGLAIERRFTRAGVHPFDELEWEVRDAVIGDPAKPAFEQRGVEFPKTWTQNATNIVAQKYFRGQLGTSQREHSVKQMVGRVAGTISAWGREGGYFASAEDADAFEAELSHILVNQLAAFNSPVWFNVGFEEQPFCSACFILSVEDTMESILAWNTKEGTIFRGGSGSGINLSKIRSSKEQLSKGGFASGPVSFMRGADAWAGTIKSGGKCFREGTLVATPDGLQPIERLRVGDEVLTHMGPRPVADFMPNGRKQCYRVVTREGYEVEVTEGHKFAYWNGVDGGFDVKPIEEFSQGESLYVLLESSTGGTTIPLLPPEIADPAHATTTAEMNLPGELDERLGYVLGLSYGDGELRTNYPYRLRVAFCKDEPGLASAARFRDYCLQIFGEEPLLLGDEEGHQQLGFTRKRLVEFLAANGIAKGKGDALGFPHILFRAEAAVRAAFIAGVIDADGSYQRRGGWSISSIDRSFLVELQRLLLSLGVPSKIKLGREQRGTWRPLYRLHIVGHTFVQRLVEHIQPHSAKAQTVYKASGGADKGWGYRPSFFEPLTARVVKQGSFRLVERSVGMNETSGYGAVAALATHPDVAVADYAREVSTCVQVTLESVTATEAAETYDIEVEDVHLLSANGIYSSNTRRAAKMVVLDVDHPDIREFIWCKAKEEDKAAALADAGFDMSIDGEGFYSIQYQNANNSVRVTDEFLDAVERGDEWRTIARVSGETIDVLNARDLMNEIAEAAWRCADPGVQYDTTINDWHTCPNTGRINASNPCSEYLHVDDSACNLSSINLLKFLRDDGTFDTAAFEHTVDVMFTAQEIIVGPSNYPTEEIGRNARAMRQLGLGYANLGALLMARGLPYDSHEGRSVAAAITALMTGRAYATSGEIAAVMGSYDEFAKNREPHLRVMRKHREAAYEIDEHVESGLLEAARRSWDEAVELGERHGHRNAQATVLAPTGCLVPNSLVLTSRGLVRLRSLGDTTGSQWQPLDIDVATDQGPRRATQFYVNGVENVVSVETKRGYRIQGTPTHRIKVVDADGQWGWKRFGDIEPGDRTPLMLHGLVGEPQEVALPPLGDHYWAAGNPSARVPRTVSAELAEFVGYFMGDGSLHSKGIRMCVAAEDQDVVDRMVELGVSLFGLDAHITDKGGYTEVAFHSVPLVMWWEACGFAKYRAPGHFGKGLGAHLPDAILHTNDAEVYAAFVRGLFEADGDASNGYASWTTVSEEFSRDVQTLLLTLGFVTTRKVDEPIGNWGSNPRYKLRLLNASMGASFIEQVGFISERKRSALIEGEHPQAARYDHVPVTREMVDEWAPENDTLRKSLLMALARNDSVSRRSAVALLERAESDPELEHLLGFFYDEVASVELIEEHPTFDLSVPDNVTYVANGFVSHNTISFLMDCDTTGIEPDFSLVKLKELVGGGQMTIVNRTVPRALRKLGYSEADIEQIEAYINDHRTIIGAPGLKDEHLPVFDVAVGKRAISPMGHIQMMAATQPFISGAISKTVNMPEDSTVGDIRDAYIEAGRLGVKALAIYRDGSKTAQALRTDAKKSKEKPAEGEPAAPARKRLPRERESLTHKFSVAGHEGYITAGRYEDGSLGEIFLTDIGKDGSTLRGMMNAFATAISIGLQYGVPLETFVRKFSYMRFDPEGMTTNPEIPFAKSLPDYIMRWLASRFLDPAVHEELGIMSEEVRAKKMAEESGAGGNGGNGHGNGHSNGEAAKADPKPAAAALTDSPPVVPARIEGLDLGPACSQCGGMMQRTGSCYTCSSCGNNTGCG